MWNGRTAESIAAVDDGQGLLLSRLRAGLPSGCRRKATRRTLAHSQRPVPVESSPSATSPTWVGSQADRHSPPRPTGPGTHPNFSASVAELLGRQLFVLLDQLHYDKQDRPFTHSRSYFIQGLFTFTVLRST